MSIFETWGVAPIINACGTVTRLGGAPLPAPVLEAFHRAAESWAPLEQLQAAASERIAAVTGAEAGLVTSGSAGALTLGAAAILAGLDLGRMERLPHTAGMANELLIARDQRSGYDHAVRAAGAVLVDVGFNEVVSGAGVRRTEAWEYDAAITEQTAGIVYVHLGSSKPSLAEVAAVARRRQLPVLVDAAGELPPRENLRRFIDEGADLVAFSGGKAIRGPQSTGILCGRRSLIASAFLQMLDMDDHFELWSPPPQLLDKRQLAGHPRHGIGRALKVSKEEIAALLTALDLFATGAYDQDVERCDRLLQSLAARVRDGADGAAQLEIQRFGDGQSLPLLNIALPSRQAAFDVCRRLRNGNPPIYVGHGQLEQGVLVVNPLCLNDDDADCVARRLIDELQVS